MPRLPQPGGDQGDWGQILNDFLTVEHSSDGSLKANGSLSTKYTKPSGGIPETDLSSEVQTKINTISGGGNAVVSVAGKTGAVSLTKGDVGLSNVDNTSDASKPVSAATQTAINARYIKPANGIPETDLTTQVQDKLNAIAGGGSGGAVVSVAGKTGTVVLDKDDVGLANVDNTSDANKPVSTATQTALNAKYTKPGSGIPETDLSTALQTKINESGSGFTPVTGAKVLVTQDFTTAATARCTSRTDVTVRWRGPVEPTNMINGDEWYVTTA